jgi:hypothetical protein
MLNVQERMGPTTRFQEMPMRRHLRRVLLTVLMVALFCAPYTLENALAQFIPEGPSSTPARKAAPRAERKMSAKERAAENAKRLREAKAARETRVWIFGRDSGRPALMFSRPSGEDAAVTFSCQPDTGLVRVIVFNVSAKGMKTGDGVRVRLSNGPARLELAATALPNDKNANAVDLGGTTKVNPKLFNLFRGDTIVLEVPGRTTGLSLKSITQKSEAFERSCLASR